VLRRVKIAHCVVLAAAILCTASSTARAQVNSRLSAGADVSIATTGRSTGDDYAHGGVLVEPLIRFGRIDPGWGFRFGLNWYEVRVDRSIGGAVTDLGEVKIRPIMGGYGYTWVRGRNSVGANLLGGFAFVSTDMSSGATDAYRRIGVNATDADASNGFVLKPELDFWHDINRDFGLNINVGYMVARPDITITTSTGVDRRTVRADQFLGKVGLVYSIF
jgi:hypothetical protein